MTEKSKYQLRLCHQFQLALFSTFFLVAVLLSVHRTGVASSQPEPSVLEELKLFSKAMGAIEYAYVDNIAPRELFYRAMKGMLQGMDPYTEFIEPDRFGALQASISGEYAGIGVALDLVGEAVVVGSFSHKSPAQIAGLQLTDRILKVDGIDVTSMSVPDVAKLIRGDVGTKVQLTIYRVSEDETFTFDVVREKIEILAVQDVRLVGKAIGYMRISHFQENTMEQVDEALASLKEQGMKALMIDLRGNDGGLLPKAVELAERFLAEGKKIVSVSSKVPEQQNEFVSSGLYVHGDYPVVILVNKGSASASEIFSAAMQDHKRGTVVGTQTYGKASVQSVIPLDEESAMKLTTARYLSPKGRMIDSIGIKPDYIVENKPGKSMGTDMQTKKALSLLKKYYK